MTRAGYHDDIEQGPLNLYRANVDRALSGKRGQAFLREMAAALDAMPVKELVDGDIVRDPEHVCAIGSVALARKLDVSKLDPYDQDDVAKAFGVARCLAAEIAYENDENAPLYSMTETEEPYGRTYTKLPPETPAERWTRMRAWVAAQIGEVQR